MQFTTAMSFLGLTLLSRVMAMPQLGGLPTDLEVTTLAIMIEERDQRPQCSAYLQSTVTITVPAATVTSTYTVDGPASFVKLTTTVPNPEILSYTQIIVEGPFTTTATTSAIETLYSLPNGVIEKRDTQPADAHVLVRRGGPPPPVAAGYPASIISSACMLAISSQVPAPATVTTSAGTSVESIAVTGGPFTTVTQIETIDVLQTTLTTTVQPGVTTTSILATTTRAVCPTNTADPFYVNLAGEYTTPSQLINTPDMVSCCEACYETTGCASFTFFFEAGTPSNCGMAVNHPGNADVSDRCPNGVINAMAGVPSNLPGSYFNVGPGPCGLSG